MKNRLCDSRQTWASLGMPCEEIPSASSTTSSTSANRWLGRSLRIHLLLAIMFFRWINRLLLGIFLRRNTHTIERLITSLSSIRSITWHSAPFKTRRSLGKRALWECSSCITVLPLTFCRMISLEFTTFGSWSVQCSDNVKCTPSLSKLQSAWWRIVNLNVVWRRVRKNWHSRTWKLWRGTCRQSSAT